MPQVFKIGPYSVYFWSNDNMPLEPIHVSEGWANPNATKIWIVKRRITSSLEISDFCSLKADLINYKAMGQKPTAF